MVLREVVPATALSICACSLGSSLGRSEVTRRVIRAVSAVSGQAAVCLVLVSSAAARATIMS